MTMPVLLQSLSNSGVLTLTMNRPAQRNALSEALMAAIEDAVTAAAEDRAVRVIVLKALGPAFCAGHDLKEMTAHWADADRGKAYFDSLFAKCSRMMQTLGEAPQPVIAAVNGIATAAGCQLVATCDLAVASEGAKFATPGVNIGLFCSTPMVALTRNVTRKHAMEMLLSGDMIEAREAERIGLVNRVVAEAALEETVGQLAERIAAKSAHTIAIGKRAFYQQIDKPLAEAYAIASEVMARNMLSADAQEGISAFIEKREPTWKDA
ncbi:MAG: enoyl-CoA hydratase [Alphaproteobacteria bacterium]|nr:enoyl-CoA hydratase [Alphaproteobacteria bacterium]